MKKIALFILFCFAINTYAANKVFIREYYYQASESDSKISSRSKALGQVKRLLLEELGVYMESYVNYKIEEKDNKITKDFFTNEIKSLSAGITETKILEENWTGSEYYIKAAISADPSDVARRINQTLEQRKTDLVIDSLKNTLASTQKNITAKNEEIEQLKSNLNNKSAYVVQQEQRVTDLTSQLSTLTSKLSIYQKQEQQLLSDIQRIEATIKNATTKAINNARIGMMPNEIVQVCGQPRSTSRFQNTLYYNYGNIWLIFESNILLKGISNNNYDGAHSASWYKLTPNILN